MYQRGMSMFGMSMREATVLTIHFMTTVYPDQHVRTRMWRSLAKSMNIPFTVDPVLAKQRKAEQLTQVAAMFGGDAVAGELPAADADDEPEDSPG